MRSKGQRSNPGSAVYSCVGLGELLGLSEPMVPWLQMLTSRALPGGLEGERSAEHRVHQQGHANRGAHASDRQQCKVGVGESEACELGRDWLTCCLLCSQQQQKLLVPAHLL